MATEPPPAPGPEPVPNPVTVSEELFAPVGEVELCYQTFGNPHDEPVLLVMGLSAPMTWWDDEFCVELASQGFHVIRFDNRDSGRSGRVAAKVNILHVVRAATVGRGVVPYLLADMAADAFALLDHLDLPTAHVVGTSMGGMIAQTMAITHPERVRSLTSIMSTTGRRTVGWQHPSVLRQMVSPRKAGREAFIDGSVSFSHLVGSPAYPFPDDYLQRRAEVTYDRGADAEGPMRQMLAILRQPDRTAALRELRMPTLVVHGLADPLVHVSGGRATATAVPGAELLLVDGMGHDLPPALHPTIVEAIRRTAARARQPV